MSNKRKQIVKQMTENSEILQMKMKLKEKLPKGWTLTVAERMKTTKQMVSRVFGAWQTESPIFNEILDLAEEHEKQQKELQKRLQNLTS